MEATYSKPKTKLMILRAESQFMDCSVRTAYPVNVEEYHDYEFSDGTTTTTEWKIGFDE